MLFRSVVFQDFSLINHTWDVRNQQGQLERVRPQDIRDTALLSIEGELDDISGSGQTEAVHGLCSGVDAKRKQHYEVKGAGHYGIFSGRRWREKVYPRVQAFIKANQPAPEELLMSSAEQLAKTTQALQVAIDGLRPKVKPKAVSAQPKASAKKPNTHPKAAAGQSPTVRKTKAQAKSPRPMRDLTGASSTSGARSKRSASPHQK